MASRNAENLLARMKATKSGWNYNDLDALYKGFGFDKIEGGKHTLFMHPKFPKLRATVTRHRSLPIGYVQTAIKLIDELTDTEARGQQ